MQHGVSLRAHRRQNECTQGWPLTGHPIAAKGAGGGGISWALNFVWEIWRFELAAKVYYTTSGGFPEIPHTRAAPGYQG